MILEAIVTTLAADGTLNVAPMGPLLHGALEDGFVLRPFQTATTFTNLQGQGCGVLHVIDDVLLLAQAAIGKIDPPPETFLAHKIAGRVLSTACRWVEFKVAESDASEPRATFHCQVVHSGRLRDHFGFNRAKHAVVEAAILATRVHLIPEQEIEREFARVEIIIGKTGGESERQAFDLLKRHIAAERSKPETAE